MAANQQDNDKLLSSMKLMEHAYSDHRRLLLLPLEYFKQQTELEEKHKRCFPRTASQLSRPSFATLSSRLNPMVFRKMFRMHPCSFQWLCSLLCESLGSEIFKPEGYWSVKLAWIEKAREKVGGILLGEIKLAIFLQMMAGGSYLDAILMYHVVHSTVYSCF